MYAQADKNIDLSIIKMPLKYLIPSIVFTIAAIFLMTSTVVASLSNSSQAVLLRNSLIASTGRYPQDFNWDPAHIPAGFLVDKVNVPDDFSLIVSSIITTKVGVESGFNKARIIEEHLTRKQQHEGYVSSDISKTYHTIMTEGQGDCADYTLVFTGIALAAGIPVRKWGMAFNGFGSGHAFTEIYDRDLGKWVFFDIYNSMYVTNATTGIPLSAIEFQSLLRKGEGKSGYLIKAIGAGRFGFESVEDAQKYYIKGSDQFFLWWGNDVFKYDRIDLKVSKIIGSGYLGRSIEQAIGLVMGVFPKIRLVKTDTNAAQIDALYNVRNMFLLSVCLLPVFLYLLFLELRLLLLFHRKKIQR